MQSVLEVNDGMSRNVVKPATATSPDSGVLVTENGNMLQGNLLETILSFKEI